MNITIPYRDEVHDGLELKFALRSIEKYLSGWDKIMILGNPPKWLTGKTHNGNDIEFIYLADYSGRKEYSTYTKLLYAAEYNKTSENFLYWNDDHFLLKPLHVSQIKFWHNGLLKDDLKRSGSARNRQAKINTLESFHRDETMLNFDIHVPIIFKKECFRAVFKDITQECCIKSTYVNAVETDGFEYMDDLKLNGEQNKTEIRQKLVGRLFFSTGSGLSTPVVQILEELCPKKSRFEL